MKISAFLFTLIVFSFSAYPQDSEKVLATAVGIKLTAKDLPDDLRSKYLNFQNSTADKRKSLLDDQISMELLETEAKVRGLSVQNLFETVIYASIDDPSDELTRSVYEANKGQIGNKSLEEVRPQIIEFLRREPEQKAYDAFAAQLRSKYKVTILRDISASALKNTDVLVKAGTTQITLEDFTLQNGQNLADFEGNLFDNLKSGLEEFAFSKLLVIEAEALGIMTNELIAREITDKLREFSDEEREFLQDNFKNKLFLKYNFKTFLQEPVPFVQAISIDDDPVRGNADAPVTVVMFSDFQCPACAAVHPVLKSVIAGFGGKVRFVVRDFPLVNAHENAFRAAVAANAAKVQGKYFEYIEVLYKNQNKLDDVSLKKYAADLGLNLERFELDLKNKMHEDEVRKDMADGNSYGINGTPTIYVNGVKIRTLSMKTFKAAIEKAVEK